MTYKLKKPSPPDSRPVGLVNWLARSLPDTFTGRESRTVRKV